MQQRDQTDSERPKVWPRTPEGTCSCPTCRALRDGRVISIELTEDWWYGERKTRDWSWIAYVEARCSS